MSGKLFTPCLIRFAVLRVLLVLGVLGLGVLTNVSVYAHDTVYYYSSDTLHSEVVVTDQNRNVVERTYYAPYGQVLNRDLRDGPGYTGHEEDPETGLVYMQQRYYDSETGRFLSVDPVQADGNGGSFNRYEYANDNPYRYTDPFGTCPQCLYWPEGNLDNQAQINQGASKLALQQMASFVPGVDAARNPTPLNVAVAVAGIVLPEAGAVGKLAKAERLAENVEQGAAAEKAVAGEIGDKVAGTHVTLESSTGQRSVADIVTKDKSVVEVKSGGARLSSGQKAIKADIDAGRPITPRGQNAANAGLEPGKPVQMKCYDEKRC